MAIGPVEYIVLGLPENRFDGSIAPELMKLVDDGIARIIDLVFITKDADGSVTAVEFDDHEALRPSGGVLVEGARIPHDLIEPALDELERVG